MAVAELAVFNPPSRTAISEEPQITDEELACLEGLCEDTASIEAATAEYEQVEAELALALRQRELLKDIEQAVAHLPKEEQAGVLSQVAHILKPSDAQQQDLAEQAAQVQQATKDVEFANELMEILADDVPLEPEEQAQLRPMAVHALNSARGEVAVALVFEKIPACFDDAAAGKVSISTTELVALATASDTLALEVASRPLLLARLSPLELMALLCDLSQCGAEAVCCEAPAGQLEQLQPEHLAILKEKNSAVAEVLFKLPHVRVRIQTALEGAEEHWRRVELLAKAGP